MKKERKMEQVIEEQKDRRNRRENAEQKVNIEMKMMKE